MARTKRTLVLIAALAGAWLPLSFPAYAASGDEVVYSDTVSGGWQDWSYGGLDAEYANANPVYAGAASIAVEFTEGWSGLQLGYHGATLDISVYDRLEFWIHGGHSGGQTLRVTVTMLEGEVEEVIAPTPGAWTQISVPLTGFSSRNVFSIQWFNLTPAAQPSFYLDEIRFAATHSPTATTPPPGIGPAVRVDATQDRRAINPGIYGMNFASEAVAEALRLPIRRWGGNSTSRYNWRLDVHNTGSDYYYENIPGENGRPDLLPAGSATDRFVEQNRRTGTDTILTVPLIGYTPKRRTEGHPYDCGFPSWRFPSQGAFDPWDSQCGNGLTISGGTILGAVPEDTSIPISPDFVTNWIAHLSGRFGSAGSGGVRYVNLDNEPMLWNSTHRDVHPQPVGFDEMRERTYEYAAAVKSADPGMRTLGPVLWGWSAYFYSALDTTEGYPWLADYQNHGGIPFVPWYLQQLRAYEIAHGVRLLDYLDLHYYPQAAGVALSPAGSASIQALRLRSTRSLWDPTYADESWIAETGEGPAVMLIPRMRAWIAANYPGTGIAITEYNWGALDSINGALAQAEVLGIFGREGVDIATLWDPPEADQPGFFAFRIYRDYDGHGSSFGEVSVRAQSDDPEMVSVFAAHRLSDLAVTVVLINKTASSLTTALSIGGITQSSVARVFQYSGDQPHAILQLGTMPVLNGRVDLSLPAYSISLAEFPFGESLGQRAYLPIIVR